MDTSRSFKLSSVEVAKPQLMTGKLSYSASVLVGHRLIVLTRTCTAWLNLLKNQWEHLVVDSEFHDGGNPTACLVKDQLYVMGVKRPFVLLTKKDYMPLFRLDLVLEAWEEMDYAGSPPYFGTGHSSLYFEKLNVMAVYGGRFSFGSSNYMHELRLLFVDHLEWKNPQTKGKSPGVRTKHSACAIGTKMFIFGGSSPQGFKADMYMIDLGKVALAWHTIDISSPPAYRWRAGMAHIGKGKLMLLGGYPRSGNGPEDLFVFEPGSSPDKMNCFSVKPRSRFINRSEGKYTLVANTSAFKDEPCLIPIGDKVVVFGGSGSSSHRYCEIAPLH